MLDAAIRRVAAVTEQQRETLAVDTMPTFSQKEKVTPVPGRSAAVSSTGSKPPTPPPTASPPTPPSTASSGQLGANGPSQAKTKLPDPPLQISVLVDPPAPSSPAAKSSAPEPAVAPPPAPALLPAGIISQAQPKQDVQKPGDLARERTPASSAGSRIPDRTPGVGHRIPLTINDLRLCRNVMGFGSFEPLNGTTLKAGQRVLIYCELAGLEYEARGAGFVSRISSRIELRPASGGPVRWEQDLGAAEDACRRRRQDYYVNYRVCLPQNLSPGSYRLRLVQTDLVAIRSTSGEIPIEIGD